MTSFVAPVSEGGNYKRVPVGNHIGRCYGLIDLGTQKTHSAMYGDKEQRQLRVLWELFGEDENGEPLVIRDSDKGVDMPMTIHKQYTFNMGTKANLRKDLAAWRGKPFTDEEVKTFDIAKLVGAYCMVNVTENESGGKTYSNVAGLSPLPKMFAANKPEGQHSIIKFSLDAPDPIVFGTFYQQLKDKIAASPEYAAWQAKKSGKAEQALKKEPAAAIAGTPSDAPFADMEDDIPF